MAKAKGTSSARSQTYRLDGGLLDRIDAFVTAFEAKHDLPITATSVVAKAIAEYLDRREPEVGIKPPKPR